MIIPSLSQRSPDRKLILISLSGGGYRASLFHAGVLRTFYEKGIISRSSEDIVLVSAVSGGSIPALVWNAFLRGYSSDPVWPEKQIFKLIEKSPHRGIAWLIRRLKDKNPWLSFLKEWWTDVETSIRPNYLNQRLGIEPLIGVLIEALDFIYGGIWVFNGESVTLPDRDLFKEGNNYRAAKTATIPQAIAAATAFPFCIPPAKIKVTIGKGSCRFPGDYVEATFVDAGVVDNLGIHAFLPLFEKHGSPPYLLQKGDAWYISDATAPIPIPLEDPASWISSNILKKRKLSLIDKTIMSLALKR